MEENKITRQRKARAIASLLALGGGGEGRFVLFFKRAMAAGIVM